jgi:2-oxoglutarate dehydrogenase E2 component (dihydrolipoamide succinyltransferase)
MTRLRQRVSARLKDSQNTYALLTTFQEADLSNLLALREQFKTEFQQKHGVKLGFMSAFVKASAVALTENPVINAVIDGEEIVYRDYIDISVAVATPKGLVVPILRNCERLSFADIEKQIVELGEKAKNGKLTLEDMTGGTFTISNGGVYGSLFGTPIVNPPQSAILGMHAINQRPVAVDGQVVIRPIMYLALTYDHRLIDGRDAVTFLRRIKAIVEDPKRLLLGL